MNNKNEGAWIFVSHSLKDWDKVRNIRNILEEKGHKPLLFFLKCLNDDSEIDDLIKREINSRNWFIMCDSDNAKESKWVNAEIDFIKSLEDKVYEVIDLEKDIKTQLDKIDRLSKRITVFLSYSHSDRTIAQYFNKKFTENDYRIFDDTQISPGADFQNQLVNGIDESIRHGFFLLLITENSLKSKWVLNEIKYALEKVHTGSNGRNIIPITFVSIEELSSKIPEELQFISNIQMFDFSQDTIDNNLNNLIKILKTKEMD